MILTASGRDSRTLRWDEPAPLGLAEVLSTLPRSRMWIGHSGKHNRISVIASVDSGAVHVSIAHSQRYPTWDEILAVRAWAFDPDTEVVGVGLRAGGAMTSPAYRAQSALDGEAERATGAGEL